jgi:hypothetical protein
VEIHVERTIDRPAAEVAPFFLDVANNPIWQKGIRSCEWATDPPIAVGSRYDQVAELRGKPVVSTFEVTGYEPGRMLRVESIESAIPIRVTRTVEPIDHTNCRIAADVSGQTAGLLPILRRIGSWVARRSIEADYDRLVKHFATASSG